LAEPKREALKVHARRAVLVSVVDRREKGVHADDLEEMRGLAETAGAEIVGTLLQYKEKPDPATYLGSGKLNELSQLVSASDADLIVFDNVLSPSQGKNIEEATGKQVVDRSEVILDIFATHARTFESKLQVELAQLLYMRPRLTRMWTHLERIEGGIGSGKGPGEKQLETDRRLVDTRISELKRKLKDVEQRRERLVASRRDHMTVSLVGYTNAGKSTLMRALTGADVYIADKLFATLDTRTRKWTIPNWGDVLLSDTVGFIKNLPHHLVASFRSTLEEARHADLLLHVVDASHPDAEHQIRTVNDVLQELGIDAHEPLLVLNKVDALEDRSLLDVLRGKHPNTVSVSAIDGTGLEKLRLMVAERLGQGYLNLKVDTSVGNGKLFGFLSEHAEVQEKEYHDNQVTLTVRIPRRFASVLVDDAQNDVRNLDGTPLKLAERDVDDEEDYSVPLSANGTGLAAGEP
jgi:GTP-binding protein HflX